jgi:hypothetical protein
MYYCKCLSNNPRFIVWDEVFKTIIDIVCKKCFKAYFKGFIDFLHDNDIDRSVWPITLEGCRSFGYRRPPYIK